MFGMKLENLISFDFNQRLDIDRWLNISHLARDPPPLVSILPLDEVLSMAENLLLDACLSRLAPGCLLECPGWGGALQLSYSPIWAAGMYMVGRPVSDWAVAGWTPAQSSSSPTHARAEWEPRQGPEIRKLGFRASTGTVIIISQRKACLTLLIPKPPDELEKKNVTKSN